jgi:hypothetical protein
MGICSSQGLSCDSSSGAPNKAGSSIKAKRNSNTKPLEPLDPTTANNSNSSNYSGSQAQTSGTIHRKSTDKSTPPNGVAVSEEAKQNAESSNNHNINTNPANHNPNNAAQRLLDASSLALSNTDRSLIEQIAIFSSEQSKATKKIAELEAALDAKDSELNHQKQSRINAATGILNQAIRLLLANQAGQPQRVNSSSNAQPSKLSVSQQETNINALNNLSNAFKTDYNNYDENSAIVDLNSPPLMSKDISSSQLQPISNEDLRKKLMDILVEFAENELVIHNPVTTSNAAAGGAASSPEPFSRVIQKSNLDDKTKRWLTSIYTRDDESSIQSNGPISHRARIMSVDVGVIGQHNEITNLLEELSTSPTHIGHNRTLSQVLNNLHLTAGNSNIDDPRLSRSLIENFDFDVLNYSVDELLVHAFHLFRAFDLLKRFDITVPTMNNFLLSVKQGYGPRSYHNFYHAMDVLHCVYLYVKKSDAIQQAQIRSLDLLSLFISSISHDIAHVGFNNQFLIATKAELAMLYNDQSVLENFHCATTFKILNQPNCNILKSLDRTEFIEARRIIISCILA